MAAGAKGQAEVVAGLEDEEKHCEEKQIDCGVVRKHTNGGWTNSLLIVKKKVECGWEENTRMVDG